MSLDLYSLKILCRVFEESTFSAAAKSLRVSQPTISQQIAKLESELGVRLFQRVGRDVVPTPQGKEVYRFALPLLEEITSFEDSMRQGLSSPRGLVRYAMPESCQWTPHFRRIMAETKKLTELQFKIAVVPSEQVIESLLRGEIDFGFAVGERVSPEIRFEKYCEEYYSAVSVKLMNPDEDFRLISFPGWENFFMVWAKGKGLWGKFKKKMKEPTIHIGSLGGAIHAAQEGAGVAIIPTHCVLEELATKKLVESYAKGSQPSNPVYIVRRIGEKLPQRVELVIDLLKRSKAGTLDPA